MSIILTVGIALILGYFLFVPQQKDKHVPIDNKKNHETEKDKKAEAPIPKELEAKKPKLPVLDLDLSQSDDLVWEHLKPCSPHKVWNQWLGNKDLIQKFVAAVNTVAEGQSPVFTLQFLTPAKKFKTIKKGDKYYQDPLSYKRYDLIAAVFSSLNPDCCYQLYQRLKPTIDKAFLQMGLEQETFDGRLRKAIEVILKTPEVAGPLILEEKVICYKFFNTRLEDLLPVQKHLLRMGPRNQKIIQKKLKELADLFFSSHYKDMNRPNL